MATPATDQHASDRSAREPAPSFPRVGSVSVRQHVGLTAAGLNDPHFREYAQRLNEIAEQLRQAGGAL